MLDSLTTSENMGKAILTTTEKLLQYAKENDLVLTNTLFPHKLAHRPTWTSLERINPHLTMTEPHDVTLTETKSTIS